jgi:hypothetical protein
MVSRKLLILDELRFDLAPLQPFRVSFPMTSNRQRYQYPDETH